MNDNNCGHAVNDDVVGRPQCGKASDMSTMTVPNHLVGAIASTCCCCMPAGIVAIVYACQVNAKLAHGDVAGAQKSSRNARRWIVVGIVLGVLCVIWRLCTAILCEIAKRQSV